MKRMFGTAAILAAVLLAACGAPAAPSTDPSPTVRPSVAPSASPEPSAAPTLPPVAYEPATVPPAENPSAATIIVPGGDGLVAIGFDGAFGSVLWTSGDGGRTWTDITPDDFASIGIASVVEYDGMLVGVGRGNTIDVDVQEAAVYLSDDGVEWRKVTQGQEMVGQLIDVVVTDDGLFAVGGVPGADSAGVWHSTDAEHWERIGGDFPQAFFWAIADGGPGLVTVGWERDDTGAPNLAVWTSADAGVTWDLAPDPEGFEGFEATDVATLPDGSLAMVGSAHDGSGGRFWHSADGVTWTVASDGIGEAWPRSLALTPIGLVAAGSGGHQLGAAWVSIDGQDWSTLGDPIEEAYVTGIHATEDGILFGGATQTGKQETGYDARAAIWLAAFD